MSDAFRCNGCDEYYDRDFRLAGVDFDREALRVADFTLDDLPNEVFSLVEDGYGDFCPDCGLEALELLVDAFQDGGNA